MNVYSHFSYEITPDQKVRIVRYEGKEETVILPNTIEGLPVTSIGQHAFAATDVIAVEVPEGIETIASEAFSVCDDLVRISLPRSLKALEKGVFKGSEKLAEIVFLNGNEQFFVDGGILYNKTEQSLVFCPPGLALETVSVLPGTKIISSAAFFQNRHLKYVKLPISVKKIEFEAFLLTASLRMIELPPYLDEIESGCFLFGTGRFAEKPFVIYAFPNTVGYRYAQENGIAVRSLLGIVTG